MAVKFNEKGHPDKKELNFDLGDCFMMGCNWLKSFNYESYHIPFSQQESTISYKNLEAICQPCQVGDHQLHSNKIWYEDYLGG